MSVPVDKETKTYRYGGVFILFPGASLLAVVAIC